jgi:hypothetical protein
MGKVQNPSSPENYLVSFDAVILFTNVPMEELLHMIRNRVSTDSSFQEQPPFQAEDITELLDICLTTTYYQ